MSEPIRALIVDDEPLARELLASMLEDEADIRVVGERGDGRSALAAIRETEPDLVFLDVEMPGMTGIEMLQELDPELYPAIIFVTAYDQFALKAFEVNAVDYLLKPFDEERLGEALERLRRRRAGERSRQTDRILSLLDDLAPRVGETGLRRIAVKRGEKTLLRRVERIEWLEAEGKYVRIHMADGETDLIRETMAALEENLPAGSFYRVSRSAIVNLDHVREIHPWTHGDLTLVMNGGASINTTRSYRDGIKRVLDNR